MIPNAIPFYYFRRMKNVLLADFPEEVRKMHAEKPWCRNSSPDLARKIATHLLKQSKEKQAELKAAKRDGEPKKYLDEIKAQIWIVIENGYVRGYRTNVRGSVAERYPDSYRNRFDQISPRRRAELVAEIMRLENKFRSEKSGRPLEDAEKCQPEEAEKIINRGLRKGGFFKYNKATDLYCGVNTPEPDPSRIISTEKLLLQAIACGDVVERDRGEDRFNSGVVSRAYIGAETLSSRRRAKEEKERMEEEERKKAEQKKPADTFCKGSSRRRALYNILADPDSVIARAICSMPLFNNNDEDAPEDEDALFGPAIWLMKQSSQLDLREPNGEPIRLQKKR